MISCAIYHKTHHVIRGDTHSNFNKMIRNWVAFSPTQEPFQKSSLGNPHRKTEVPSPCEASLLTQLFTLHITGFLFPPKFILEVSAFILLLLAVKQIVHFTVYTHTRYWNKQEYGISRIQAFSTTCTSFLPHYVISFGDLEVTTGWYGAVNQCSKQTVRLADQDLNPPTYTICLIFFNLLFYFFCLFFMWVTKKNRRSYLNKNQGQWPSSYNLVIRVRIILWKQTWALHLFYV